MHFEYCRLANSSPTFAVVRHDCVAEGQHPEEEVGVLVSLLDLGQQVLVVELEGGLVEPVLGEVHPFGVLNRQRYITFRPQKTLWGFSIARPHSNAVSYLCFMAGCG